MGYRPRSPAERMKHRLLISKMYLQGKSQMEIGAQVGISQATVSADLRALNKAWQASALLNLNERRARELAKIDFAESEAWVAWEASKQKISETTTQVVGKDNDGELQQTKATVTTVEAPGDIAYWNAAMRCVEMRVKLLGLNEPESLRVVDEDYDHAKWISDHDMRLASALNILTEDSINGQGEPQPQG